MTTQNITVYHLWFWLLTRLVIWVIFSLLCSFIVAIILCDIKHPAMGFDRLQALLQLDYRFLATHLSPQQMNWLDRYLAFVHRYAATPDYFRLPVLNVDNQLYFWQHAQPVVQAILLNTQLLMLRLYCLFKWSWLYLLLGLVGLVDGLAKRYVRRMSVGLESAFIYHHAKPLVMASLLLGVFLSLVLPLPISVTQWLLFISLLLFVFTLQMSAKSFKKYL